MASLILLLMFGFWYNFPDLISLVLELWKVFAKYFGVWLQIRQSKYHLWHLTKNFVWIFPLSIWRKFKSLLIMYFSCLGTTNQESVSSFGLLTAAPAKSKIELILQRKKSETSTCIRINWFQPTCNQHV